MSIDLNGIGPGQVNTRRTASEKPLTTTTQPIQTEQSKAQAAPAQGDKVSLDSMKQLEQKLGSFPEMDDARIEQIKAALTDGSYKVDAEKLAQKMLDMDESIFG